MDNLIVGDAGTSFLEVCDALGQSASAGLLFLQWKDLAECLHLDSPTILSIEKRFLHSSNKNPSYEPVIYEILLNWRAKAANKASLSTLINALNRVGLQDTAEEMEHKFLHSISVRTKGGITYDTSADLGSGQNSVYKGRFDNKSVAVKRIFCKSTEDMKIKLKEVEKMMMCDEDDNVIKYLKMATDTDFIYIAMELCQGTLQNWIDEKIEKIDKTTISPVEILRQTTKGLMYLHRKEMVHGDLKPENILFHHFSKNAVQVKIADFGLSKVQIPGGNTESGANGSKSMGWMAPEILTTKSYTKDCMSKSTDIFSLGLLFFYVLTDGHHPFGDDNRTRIFNIKCNVILGITRFLPDYIKETSDWLTLLNQMIMINPNSRPSAEEVLSKRKLWNSSKSGSESELQSSAIPENDMFTRVVGNISYDVKKILGKGGNANVFHGTFQQRTVAVKKLYCRDEMTLSSRLREISIMVICDSHENIIRYFAAERDNDFIYIALELCDWSLREWTENNVSITHQGETTNTDILLQTTKGLAHLHSLGIIHRDLNPQNVLLYRRSDGNLVAKITDFGISKILPDDSTSMTVTAAFGTTGWMAPETLRFHSTTPEKMSTQTDIFSLGCLYYYVLSGGRHPFGENRERDLNIMGYKLTGKDTDLPTIMRGNFWLILEMIKRAPFDRPNANDILYHNIFWSKKKSLDFIFHVASLLRNHKTRDIEKCKWDLENIFETEAAWKSIVGSKTWKDITSKDIQLYIEKLPKNCRDHHMLSLLRSIRNMWTHYGNLPDSVKMAFGHDSDSFYDYWVSIFPYLVSTIWVVFQHLKANTYEYNLEPYYGNKFHFGVPSSEMTMVIDDD